ncbi:MAG: hypothetical protein HYV07_23845 [Deltaproteobacteria bacterium]|nr:hypothetical protein [Deltaproteobacteria bacterium]
MTSRSFAAYSDHSMDPMDIRLRERLLRKGAITHEQVARHLAELPDLEARATYIDYERVFEAEVKAERASGGPVALPVPGPKGDGPN